MSDLTLPALTLWQPYASLMATGAKRIETRSWRPSPRQLPEGGLLAIHAAKHCEPLSGEAERCFHQAMREAGEEGAPLPAGAVVAIVRFLRARPTSWLTVGLLTRKLTSHTWAPSDPRERAFGDYSPNRWGWETELVLRLEPPILARGRQGIWRWEVPDPIAAKLRARGALE